MARKALLKAFALTPASTAIVFAVVCVMLHIAPFLCPKLVPLCPSAAVGRHEDREDEGGTENNEDWEPWLATPEGRPSSLLLDPLVGAGKSRG